VDTLPDFSLFSSLLTAHQMTTTATNPITSDVTSSVPSSGVQPSEVGWQFVPQYYNYVNKYPNRLHCFYTKASTFSHGTEGEDGKPFFGQQVSFCARFRCIAFFLSLPSALARLIIHLCATPIHVLAIFFPGN
jgi:hypothetical protein